MGHKFFFCFLNFIVKIKVRSYVLRLRLLFFTTAILEKGQFFSPFSDGSGSDRTSSIILRSNLTLKKNWIDLRLIDSLNSLFSLSSASLLAFFRIERFDFEEIGTTGQKKKNLEFFCQSIILDLLFFSLNPYEHLWKEIRTEIRFSTPLAPKCTLVKSAHFGSILFLSFFFCDD